MTIVPPVKSLGWVSSSQAILQAGTWAYGTKMSKIEQLFGGRARRALGGLGGL
ncbi:hypothetical protein Pyn_23494 [Prunus yedoensis var. nudiflora]|uniref:Uncharacterized protein n=1 Tax=Prunus yedoensis var. nudiflora TaxID=2094558 RepID=A0A314ZIB9_PRUYE|nr:hypothetical protein Pyn_23494 [Prunus yedoensis var. nudiflora]